MIISLYTPHLNIYLNLIKIKMLNQKNLVTYIVFRVQILFWAGKNKAKLLCFCLLGEYTQSVML